MTEKTETGVIRLNDSDAFVHESVKLTEQSIRSIDLLVNHLEKPWLGHSDFIEAIKQAVISNRRLHMRILMADLAPALEDGHPLLPLIRRLSRIEARLIDPQTLAKQPIKAEMLIVDRGGIVMKQSADQYIGFAHHDDKQTVLVQQDLFNQYWRFNKPHADLRHVYL